MWIWKTAFLFHCHCLPPALLIICRYPAKCRYCQSVPDAYFCIALFMWAKRNEIRYGLDSVESCKVLLKLWCGGLLTYNSVQIKAQEACGFQLFHLLIPCHTTCTCALLTIFIPLRPTFLNPSYWNLNVYTLPAVSIFFISTTWNNSLRNFQCWYLFWESFSTGICSLIQAIQSGFV